MKNQNKKITTNFCFYSLIIGLFCIALGIIITGNDAKQYQFANSYCKKLYKKNQVIETVSIKEIETCLKKTEQIVFSSQKKELIKNANETKKYLILKEKINSEISNNVLKDQKSEDNIETISNESKQLRKDYTLKIKEEIKSIEQEVQYLKSIHLLIQNLFVDDSLTTVKESITKAEYESVKYLVNNINNIEVKNKYQELLNEAEKQLLIQKQEEEIKRSWVTLDVPYVSQNRVGVLNGCEAASLLMGIKYKGYLTDMDLITYAKNMPKSDDPNKGFYLDIFGLQPLTESHWIAPEPLAKYGQTSGANVIDGTGMSINELDRELDNGNPVVIYLTSEFKEAEEWSNGVPKNLHVQLLTGYNKITGEHLITDPWTQKNGDHHWVISKNTIETIYNNLGKRSVIIR